jgi:hypothetical protein
MSKRFGVLFSSIWRAAIGRLRSTRILARVDIYADNGRDFTKIGHGSGDGPGSAAWMKRAAEDAEGLLLAATFPRETKAFIDDPSEENREKLLALADIELPRIKERLLGATPGVSA